MAQTINIAELDIDIDALTKKASDVRVNLIDIGKEIEQLKKDFKDGNISVNEYAEKLTTLTAVQKENQKELRVYDAMLQANLATEAKKEKGNERMTGSIRELSTALSQNKKIYQELSQVEREDAEVGGKLLKTIQEQDKKYKELQKSIGNTQVEVGNYKEEVKKALQEHYGLDAQVSRLTDSLGIFKTAGIGVVNSLKSFVSGNQQAIQSLYDAETGVRKVSLAKSLWKKAINSTSLALKILRGALVATGIGAFVVVLGSLVSYLTSTQEGINRVNSVLTPLKEVFASLWGLVQNVGKSLFEAFSNPKQALIDFGKLIKDQIINRLTAGIELAKGFYKVITGDFKEGFKQMGDGTLQAVTGVEKMTDKIKELGETMGEAWERGKEIADLENELREMNITYQAQQERLKREYQEQLEISEDITKTQSERLKALDEAKNKQSELNALVSKHVDLEVKILEKKAEANDTSDADKQEIANKLAEKDAQDRETVRQERLLQKKRNAIGKEALAEAKKRIETEIQEQKKQIEHYVKTNSAVANSLQERLNIEEKAKDDRLAVLEKEKKIGKISKEEYEREKYNIETEYLKVRADLSLEAVQREAELYEANNKTKIDKETKLTAELITEEQNRLQAIHDKKVEALEEEKRLKTEAREWDYNTEAEYQAQLNELKQSFAEEYQETTKSLNETYEAQQREEKKTQQALDFEEKILKLQEQGASEFMIKEEQLNQAYRVEIDQIDKLHREGKLSEEQYLQSLHNARLKNANVEKALREDVEKYKLNLAQSFFGEIKNLFGEHTAISKVSAVAETTISTYKAAQEAYANAIKIPVAGLYLAPVFAGLAIAAGLKNIQKIASVDTKFQKGGLVRGRSHAEGGVPFTVQGQGGYEMEGGEYIVNKKATIQYFPILEALNKSTLRGDIQPLNFFRYGGLVSGVTNPVSKIDMTEIVDAVREGSMMGAYEGAKQGSQEGSQEGTRQGSYEGATQGTYEGATLGTSTGLYESSLKNADYVQVKNTSVV